jgi:predicted transcriptional regulator
MGSAKDEVRKILDKIPEDATLEDIQYHIYVREKIERGLEDVREGRVVAQEEVENRMRRWTGE